MTVRLLKLKSYREIKKTVFPLGLILLLELTKAAKEFQQKLTQNSNSTTSTTQKDIKRKKK